MNMRRTNAILAIAIILTILPVCTQAGLIPPSIAGTVDLSDGVTQAPTGTIFNVTSTIEEDGNVSESRQIVVEMPKQDDPFQGSFAGSETPHLNQVAQITFSVIPEADMPNSTIKFFLPIDVELVEGDLDWHGDLKEGQQVSLDLFVDVTEEVEQNIKAEAFTYIDGIKITRSYYTLVSTMAKAALSPTTGQNGTLIMQTMAKSINMSNQPTLNLESTGYIEVIGKCNYVNENGGLSPMRSVYTELWDYENGIVDECLGYSYTDDDGNFYYHVDNNDGYLESGRDVYVIVYAYSNAARTTDHYYDAPYAMGTSIRNDVSDGVVDFGSMYPASYSEAWEAVDAALSEYIWIYSQVGWTRSQVHIKWPSGTWPCTDGERIYLPYKATAGWEHDTVHHEYAHCVMWNAYGDSWPPSDYSGHHQVDMESDEGFATIEGWAEFMQCVVDNDPNNLQYVGQNIETNDWYNEQDSGDFDGDIVEGSFASILWDIFDPANDDSLNTGFDEIWTIVFDDRPGSIHDIWDGWFIRGYGHDQALWQIYYNYGVNKDTTPPPAPVISSSTHPNENNWYNNNDPTFTWTTPLDDLSGIAGYSCILDQSSSTTPDTSVDTTGNSDSYSNKADGTWYFHVRAKDNAGNWGSVDHYTVKIEIEIANPSATVNSPNGGESWQVGAQHDITWTAIDDVGVTSVDIMYSINGGSTYPYTIATGETNDGTYSWTIPNTPSTTCKVQVIAYDVAGNQGEDVSNANFEIYTEEIPPQLVAYTITNRTIIPPQTTEIDVTFSEEVAWIIAIENSSVIYDWSGTSTNLASITWDGTYEIDGTRVPNGVYHVSVTGTSATTGLSVVNNAETITVASEPSGCTPPDIAWNVAISATNQLEPVVVGMDPDATDGYDPDCDAYAQTPVQGRVTLTLDDIYSTSIKKTRCYDESVSWTLLMGVPTDQTTILSWDVPANVDLTIAEGGNTLYSGVELSGGAHELLVTAELIESITFGMDLKAGWNMISVPLAPDNCSVYAIFGSIPTLETMPVVTWDSPSFVEVEEIEPKMGYWVFTPTDATINVAGKPITDTTLILEAGWNMVGTIGLDNLMISTIPNQAPQSPAVTWITPSFVETGVIEPGKSAWVFVTTDTTVVQGRAFSTEVEARAESMVTESLARIRAAPTATIEEWSLTISATNQLEPATFGIHPDATNGYDDGFDDYADLPVQDKVILILDGIYATEINKDKLTWNLGVGGVSAGQTTTLTWNPSKIPADVSLTLNGIDMKSQDSIELGGGSHSFVINAEYTTIQVTISLDSGWNLISAPLNLTTWKLGDESAVGDPLNVTPENSLTSIYRYNTTSELFEKCTHYAGWGWAPATGSESFTELEPGRGYWVMADSDCDLTFTGTAPSDLDMPLDADWNCIGWYSTSAALLDEEAAVGDPLSVTPENSLTSIYRYNSSTGLFEKCTHYADWGWAPATGSESFTELEPGRGYWVMAENDCLWGHEV